MGGGTRMTRMVTLLTAAIISILAHSGGANQLSYQHNKGPDAAIFPPPRVTLSQAEACYYQPYHQHLACQCPERAPSEQAVDTDRVFLALHMEYWVNTMGQKVRSIKVHSCRDLLIGLDLTSLNPTQVPITFVHSAKITVDYIRFDKTFAGNQKLVTKFRNVEHVAFQGLHVDEAIEIGINNVKFFLMESSTFSHLPSSSVVVESSSRVIIRDCIFLRMVPSSVTVRKTKQVEVLNNEMSLNAIKAVSTSDGSHLVISCNRLLGDPVAPECLPTTTMSTSTVSITLMPQLTSSSALLSPQAAGPHHHPQTRNEATDIHLVSGVTMETLIGVISGALVILTVLVIIIVSLVVRKHNFLKKLSRSDDYILHSEEQVLAPVIPPPPPLPPSPLYNPEDFKPGARAGSGNVMSSLHHPVWLLDEIQANPLFSKQKYKLEDEEAIPLRSISGE